MSSYSATISRSVRVLVLSIIFVGTLGCTATGRRDTATHSKRGAGTVASPLAVTVENPKALGGINSLALFPPALASAARDVKIDKNRVAELVESVAVQELDLKVLGNQWFLKSGLQTDASLSSAFGGVLTETQKRSVKKAGADGILYTELLEYVDRVGSSVGGEPAAVAFRLTVVGVTEGKVVWQGTYSLRQEALTDNLLKIGERLGKDGTGAGWSTGSAMLQNGLIEALRDLRGRREQQFLAGAPK
jgi:hypothetical protein